MSIRHFLHVMLYCLVSNGVIAMPSISFLGYDIKNSQLLMHLVTPTTKGEVLLRVGEKMHELKGAQLLDLFTLSVHIPCERLSLGASIYWATSGYALINASIPPQECHNVQEPSSTQILLPVRFFNKSGVCWIDVNNNTLWRTATEMSRWNKFSVYQNMYGIFLANREAFVGEDINRLNKNQLRCPSVKLIKLISQEDSYRLFKEMLEFNKRR